MKLFETLKNKVLHLLKTWQVREKLCFLWTKIKNSFARIAQKLRPYQRFKNTRAYAKLMAMTEMRRRMTVMLVGVFLLLGLIFAFNQAKTMLIKHFISSAGLPPATVSTTVVQFEEWQPMLSSVGNMRAYRGVELSTGVEGLVERVPVKSGMDVKEGSLLIKLVDTAEVAQLQSLKAQAELAKVINERDKQQLAIQAISKNVFDTSAADAKSKRALVQQQEALIVKKNLKAPFSGRVGIVTLNPGQYVSPSEKLMTLQTIDPIFIDFTLPQSTVSAINIGQSIALSTDAYKGVMFAGKITAISPKVDLNTRNIQIEALLANPDKKILPGMFANVNIDLGDKVKLLTLPLTAVTYNPYGSTVFIAKKTERLGKDGQPVLEAQQVFVTTGSTRGDQVAITKGLEAGATVVTSGQLKLKNGTPLIINNKVLPANSPNPKPQEN